MLSLPALVSYCAESPPKTSELLIRPVVGGFAVRRRLIFTYLIVPTVKPPTAQRTAFVFDGKGLDVDRLRPAPV
jgi:hypothetical protein